jgi:hypothetical protein
MSSKNKTTSRKPNKLNKPKAPGFYIETHNKQKIPIYFDILNDASGYCFNPDGPTPKIIISKNLLKRRKLNVLIEEIAHAFWYDAPEYKVRKFSAQLGKLIYSLFLKK